MKQYNCRNCGAPVEHLYNHKCPYCDSLLDFNLDKEDTKKIDWHNVSRIEYLETYIDFKEPISILKFRCTQYSSIEFIETSNNYSLAKMPQNKDFYFAIAIDKSDFYYFENKFDCIREVLLAKIPNREIAIMGYYDYMRKVGTY